MDKTENRRKLEEYLLAQQARRAKMETPEFRQMEDDQAMRAADSSSRNNLAALMMNSAAQMGTINGKTADASPMENFAKQQNAGNAQYRNALAQEDENAEKRYGVDARVYQYLADKEQKTADNEATADYRRKTLAQHRTLAESKAQDEAKRRTEDRAFDEKKFAQSTAFDREKLNRDEKMKREQMTAAANKATEAQLGSANFGRKAQDSDAIVRQIELDGYDPSSHGRTARGLPVIGEFTKSQDDRKYQQAQKEFIAAILRKESGGAITPDEFSEYGKIYFPQPGEGKEVVAQKAASRKAASENLITMSGKAAAGVMGNRPPPVASVKQEPGTAIAAPQAKPDEEMTDAELDAEIARLKGGK